MDNTVRLWKWQTHGDSMVIFQGHTDWVSTTLEMHGSTCKGELSCSSDNTPCIWETRSGKHLLTQGTY